MQPSSIFQKISTGSLSVQCALVVVAAVASAIEPGLVFGWSLALSLVAGVATVLSSIVAAVLTRRFNALWPAGGSVLAACAAFFVGLTAIGFGV